MDALNSLTKPTAAWLGLPGKKGLGPDQATNFLDSCLFFGTPLNQVVWCALMFISLETSSQDHGII